MNNIQIGQAIQLQKARLNLLQRQRDSFDSSDFTKTNVLAKKLLAILDDGYAAFTQKHEELLTNIKPDDQEDFDYFIEDFQKQYEEFYLKLYVDIEATLSSNIVSPSSNENHDNDKLLQIINQFQSEKHAKLPHLDLPRFSGKYIDWNAFQDQFRASVHNISRIPPVQKLQHLLNALSEPAKDLIKHLSICDLNYEIAWKILIERYENKRAIFMNGMKQLLTFQRCKNENIRELQSLSSVLNETNQVLKNVGVDVLACDPILAYVAIEKLSNETRKEFEKSIGQKQELPTFKDVCDRIQLSIRTLELLNLDEGESGTGRDCSPKLLKELQSKSQQSTRKSIKSLHMTKGKIERATRDSSNQSKSNSMKCALCGDEHSIRSCSSFLALSTQERVAKAGELKLCYNCLSGNHIKTSCLSKKNCNECGARHHSLLHATKSTTSDEKPTVEISTPTASTSTIRKNVLTSKFDAPIFRSTLLSTAIVRAKGSNGIEIPLRALIDLGGEASAISESALQSLRIPKTPCSVEVTHLDRAKSESGSYASFVIESYHSTFATTVDALVMRSLVNRLPTKRIYFTNWSHIRNLELADPNYDQTGDVDLVLGAEVCSEIILPDVRKGEKGTPAALKTEFGWIIFGKTYNKPTFNNRVSINTFSTDVLLEKFFEIENVAEHRLYTKEEKYCIDFFNQTFRRDSEGRFIIKLPFRTIFDSTAVLGQSREIALRQFLFFERKFAQNPKFRDEYNKNIMDYLEQGHMRVATDTEINHRYVTENGTTAYNSFYLPHHPVIRESSTSTPIRPVFNASKKTSNGKSLNDVLFPGPAFQNDLNAILINWRFHLIAIMADIQKMYRQIRIHEENETYLRILHRNDPSEEIKEYAMTTLTFGLNYAPCGAIQTVRELADQNLNEFPEASTTIKRDTYVDDVISGSYSINAALKLQQETINIFDSAGFKLKKWASNCDEVLQSVPAEDREVNIPLALNPEKTIKTLGVFWNTSLDVFHYRINYNEENLTKRFVLSTIARIYDPLGFIAPVIAKAKIFMKRIWNYKLEWDDLLPNELIQEWQCFTSVLMSLTELKIPRWINTTSKNRSIELHGFADASADAYGAVIYLRCINQFGQVTSSLIISKSKIAPVKMLTIPRLELCAALLLADLMKYTLNSIRHVEIKPEDIYFWSDSEIVLHWLRGEPQKWKIFIANRIIKIQETSDPNQWHHISTRENPADLVSRGSIASEFIQNELWFNGPSWLTLDSEFWPINGCDNLERIDETLVQNELKSKVIGASNIEISPTNQLLHYCSNHIQLLRYSAWLRRFFNYLADKIRVKRGSLSVDELLGANNRWIAFVQHQQFYKEMNVIRNQHEKKKTKHRLWKLNPFIDQQGLFRVGGRLSFANLSFDEKHPLLLPQNHHYSELVINFKHTQTLHGGVQLTLAELQRKYWLLGRRNYVRKVINKCVTCCRQRDLTTTQLMGELPAPRVNISRPFSHTGMDLCGPISIRLSKKRGSRTYQGFVVIFICMCVKAVHLEPVTDLSSEAFLMSFQRFVSRRGLCSDLYSDCGTNFVGARRMLREDELDYLRSLHRNLSDVMTNMSVNFHFNPPSAPTFGGLWESNVRSVKHHLKRVIGDESITFDDLSTLLARIESCLNSRPLLPMSDDPDDFTFITPGHFLIGDSLLAVPEPYLLDEKIPPIKRYRAMLKRTQSFWLLWQRDYLQSLQNRPKWLRKEPNFKIGDVVLIKRDNLPPLKWIMGRVIETHPGSDGLVRVCSVKTANGIYKRPIVKLSPLPINENEYVRQLLQPQEDPRKDVLILTSTVSITPEKTMTVLVEGNIGAGKSTVLEYFAKYGDIQILVEPLAKWQNLNGVNLLDRMYGNSNQWSFPFQNYAMLTMLENHFKQNEKRIKLMERSIYSAKYCFTKASEIQETLQPAMAEIMQQWFNFIEQHFTLQVDLIIYLRTTPEIIIERIKNRGRIEEENIDMNYLKLLHQLHDDWLLAKAFPVPARVIVLNGDAPSEEVIKQITAECDFFSPGECSEFSKSS